MNGTHRASRRRRGRRAYLSGLVAEDIVARRYERAGHSIVARRWRGEAGEIDMVVRDDDGLVFVEIKSSFDHARAALNLGARQVDRICQAAAEFLGGQPLGALSPARFDVALVARKGQLDILENAIGH